MIYALLMELPVGPCALYLLELTLGFGLQA